MSYIKDRGIITFIYLKTEQKKTVIWNLFEREQQYHKDMKSAKIDSKKLTKKVQKKKTKQTKLTGL